MTQSGQATNNPEEPKITQLNNGLHLSKGMILTKTICPHSNVTIFSPSHVKKVFLLRLINPEID
jgi:hypothetical protein